MRQMQIIRTFMSSSQSQSLSAGFCLFVSSLFSKLKKIQIGESFSTLSIYETKYSFSSLSSVLLVLFLRLNNDNISSVNLYHEDVIASVHFLFNIWNVPNIRTTVIVAINYSNLEISVGDKWHPLKLSAILRSVGKFNRNEKLCIYLNWISRYILK